MIRKNQINLKRNFRDENCVVFAGVGVGRTVLRGNDLLDCSPRGGGGGVRARRAVRGVVC